MSEEAVEGAPVPNWLRELEEKRERRLKARLGHEAGAGSPCLECKERCPGLDLHFWRKICKNCKCGKENHDVQDDDMYGLLQIQQPKNQKIVLPGRKDAVVLEWTPKGSREAVESYLKDLPPERLPIKGSSAAQERKQLLQKQIPMHDVDPTLCHALTEEETAQMTEYVNHLKENSVGVGQLTRVVASARLVSTVVSSNVPDVKPVDLSDKLRSLRLKAHDYENIDEFGKPRLEEELERLRQKDEAQARYAMLLDADGVPVRDRTGAPIRASLDVHRNPVICEEVAAKLNGKTAEYAMLLDRNGAPVMDAHGHPVKSRLDRGEAQLLDGAGAPLLDKYGNPVMVTLDSLERVHVPGAEYACPLDRNGRPKTDRYGQRIMYKLPSKPELAVLVDKHDNALKDRNGEPIKVALDEMCRPVVSAAVVERLGTQRPDYAVLLDGRGTPLKDEHGNVLRERLGPVNGEPRYGLLLDVNNAPIDNLSVELDDMYRAIVDDNLLERYRPRYSMLVDGHGVPVLDVDGQPVKEELCRDPVYDQFGNELVPKYGVLLNKNERPVLDSSGNPVTLRVDSVRRPVTSEALRTPQPQFLALLDANRTPILDKYGNVVEPVTSPSRRLPRRGLLLDAKKESLNVTVPLDATCSPVVDAQAAGKLGPRRPAHVMLLDRHGCPVTDGCGQPVVRPYEPTGLGLFLDGSGAPIKDVSGTPIKVRLDRTGRPLLDDNTVERLAGRRPEYVAPLDDDGRPVLDKYGSPVRRPALPSYRPLNAGPVGEDAAVPTPVSVGAIEDLHYPEYEIHEPRGAVEKDKESGVPRYEPGKEDRYDPIPECHRCKKMLEDDALAIQIERSEALWHSTCFKCAGCGQNLVDLVYFYHRETDDVYCGRDFAKIRGIPRCKACDELIFVKEYCLAENETYHVRHFCCFECDTPLAGQQYVVEPNQQPVCVGCFEKLKADVCAACSSIIRPDEQGANLNGTHFHADDGCFCCRSCSKPLLEGKFLFRNGRLYCSGACHARDNVDGTKD